MSIQSILTTYKNIPANSVRFVKTGVVIKGENSIIHVVPNLKREFMMQVGDTFQTGITFYENSFLAELLHNNARIPFNTSHYAFVKQYSPTKEFSKTSKAKNKLLGKEAPKRILSKKQNIMNISQNDRFKHVLEKLPQLDITQALTNIYMTANMQYKGLFEAYKCYFKKNFFTNIPNKEIVLKR